MSITAPPAKITITSYSHQLGPLHPRPDLKYNLRSLPNPTRELRASYDGRHKRLRGYMMEFPVFVALLNQAFEEIVGLVGSDGGAGAVFYVSEEGAGVDGGKDSSDVEEAEEEVEVEDVGTEEEDETEGRLQGRRCQAESNVLQVVDCEQGVTQGPSRAKADSLPQGTNVKVGVFCVRGRHRSVAFVEQLARMEWPKGWEVRVKHRDVDKRGTPQTSKNGRRGT